MKIEGAKPSSTVWVLTGGYGIRPYCVGTGERIWNPPLLRGYWRADMESAPTAWVPVRNDADSVRWYKNGTVGDGPVYIRLQGGLCSIRSALLRFPG